VTCLPADCCYDGQVGRHAYRQTVDMKSKWATCLPADCCYDVQVGRHVYRRTVVMMAKWGDMSNGGLLLYCPSEESVMSTFEQLF
jgi:hypothetical protein